MAEDNMKKAIKEGKLKNIKDFFTRLKSDDPFIAVTLTAILTTFFPVLLTILVQAIWEYQLRIIFLVLQIIAAITFILVLPLLIVRIWSAHHAQKTQAEITGINDFIQLKKYIEHQKHTQVHKLTDARIDNIKTNTQFILSFSTDFMKKTMREKATTLQANFNDDNIHQTMVDVLNTLGEVITRFNAVDQQYEKALHQIHTICDNLGIKVEDLIIEPIIDPKKSTKDLEHKFNQILHDIPAPTTPDSPTISSTKEAFLASEFEISLNLDNLQDTPTVNTMTTWQCPRCHKTYPDTLQQCRTCGKTKPP